MWMAILALAVNVNGSSEAETPNLRCGGYCLYVSLVGLDLPPGSYEELEQALGQPTAAGYSMGQLAETAEEHGAHVLAVQTTFENLQRRGGRFACIAHINGNHFVNFADVADGKVHVIDPPRSYSVPLDTMRTQWDGTALLLSPEPLLAEEDLPSPFPWQSVIGGLVAAFALYTGWVVLKRTRRSVAPKSG